MMNGNYLLARGILLGVFATFVMALQCYQCGQYNDGIGSITPCINETYMKLKECPSLDHIYCIKYISEGSTVRDCVPKCTQREDWGTKTFCCMEDGCNSGYLRESSRIILTICEIFVFIITMMALH